MFLGLAFICLLSSGWLTQKANMAQRIMNGGDLDIYDGSTEALKIIAVLELPSRSAGERRNPRKAAAFPSNRVYTWARHGFST
ncbi:hypothetical protein BDV36DRAFT_291114 [Aspergillus pseudocaelatus]|uniref:Uncharacterized protein n=1 Tax=Aspergillus pseudocaelatus TaxID=1825620 RepID=A0ABQ6X183_9EURO|nr:hypothetical protein BDV36DRAFT_291114 [Aspergillus pseudocaelatus]